MTDQPSKDALLELARMHLQAGRIDKAIHEYQKIAALDPNDLRVQLRIAELFVKQKQLSQAVKIYQDVADKYVEGGFYLKAVTVYKAILRLNPALREVNMALAELYEKMGLDQDAIHQYQILLRFYEQKGMADQAMELRQRVVALDPDNVTNRVRLAESYQLQGQEEASLREYEQVADRMKDTGTDEQLIDLYEKILAKRPTHGELLKRLCRLLERKADYRHVLHWMTVCAAVVAEDADLLRMQADFLGRLNQIESARTKWRELAELLISREDDDEALKAYEEMLLLAPDEGHEVEEAVERIRVGAFAELTARVQARMDSRQREEEAQRVMEAAEEEAADHIRQQEDKARERASRQGRGMKPLSPEEQEGARQTAEASVHLGDAYLQMGLRDEALVEYQKALDWQRRLLASGAGTPVMVSEVKRLERLIQGDEETTAGGAVTENNVSDDTTDPSARVQRSAPVVPVVAAKPAASQPTAKPEQAPAAKPPSGNEPPPKPSSNKKRISYV